MAEQKDQNTRTCVCNLNQCRREISEMTGQIEDERFLKAICISMSDYLKENEPE